MRDETLRSRGKYIYRGICCILITALCAAGFFYVWFGFVAENNTTGKLLGYGNLLMSLGIYTILLMIFMRVLQGYKIGVHRIMRTVAGQIIALLITDVAEIFVSMAVTGHFRMFLQFLWRYALLFLAQSVAVFILSTIMIRIYIKVFPPLRIIEVFGGKRNGLYEKLGSRPDKYVVSKVVVCPEDVYELRDMITEYDAVVVNDVSSAQENRILKMCFDLDKRVYFVPKISDIIVRGAEELNIFDTPLYLCRNQGISVTERFIKRLIDIVVSLVALIVLSPVMLITALAIKLEDRGPAFFKQERCTVQGKKFNILKFRSMIVDAEKDGRPHPAGEKDPRITKVGSFIRATRIDELPQLLNILGGDMSLVGPRPERVEHVEKYTEEIREFTFREKMKGGLTGYAQVYGKYNTTALDKLKLDMTYIMNYSLLLDLQIILETIRIVFVKESTEGFTEEKIEEMQKSIKEDEG